jgi:ADP-ribose pyrophosphatase YjhB (NUDIX family)
MWIAYNSARDCTTNLYTISMHMYQKHILDELRQAETLRYSQMQPEGVESSHFKYHLNQLLKEGLVEQVARGEYKLSVKGQAAVDRLSEDRINPHLTPKVITYTLLQDGTNYYLYRKHKEPYLGTLNMIAGKLHIGETAEQAAVREVKEKADLDSSAPQLRAVANIRIGSDEQLITHMIAYVFVAELHTAVPALETVPIAGIESRDDLAPDLLLLLAELKKDSAPRHLDLDIKL